MSIVDLYYKRGLLERLRFAGRAEDYQLWFPEIHMPEPGVSYDAKPVDFIPDDDKYAFMTEEDFGYDSVEDFFNNLQNEGYLDGFYHVTTNIDRVMQEGLRSRSDLRRSKEPPGLGGGFADEASGKVSVTYSLDAAYAIYSQLKFVAGIINGTINQTRIFDYLSSLFDNQYDFGIFESIDDIIIAEVEHYYDLHGKKWPEDLFSLFDEMKLSPRDLYDLYLKLEFAFENSFGDSARPRNTAGLTARFETMKNIDPNKIGIVEVMVKKTSEYEHVFLEQELRFNPKDVLLKRRIA